MAVSKVRKLQLIAHAECREEILKTLRSLGAVHISDVREFLPDADTEYPAFLEHSLVQVKEKLARIMYSLLFLERFIQKGSFLESLLKTKPVFTPQELEQCLTGFDADSFYEECNSIEKEMAENDSQIEKKEALAEDVALWLRLQLPLEEIRDTKTTVVSMGICDGRACTPLLEELSEATPLYHAEVVERSQHTVSTLLIYSKSVDDIVTPILRKYGWRPVRFIGLTGTPSEAFDRLREQIRELRQRNEELRHMVSREMAPTREKLLLLHDQYSEELKSLQVQSNFFFTNRTFLVTGWTLAKEEQHMRRRLRQVTQVVELRCSDPAPGDKIPILIENPPAVRPFSLITELYGRPQYTEFDPTPLFFPFFVLFFGVCLGDAGYGIVLMLISWGVLKKFEIRGGARSLLQILGWGGFSSAVVGLLTGGIFGIETTKLPVALQRIMLFNPTRQVVLFLYIAFLLGLIQVLFGIGVKMVRDFRDGNIAAALIDQALWILLLISITPVLYKYLFGGRVADSTATLAAKASLVVAIPLVIGRGRGARIIFLRPLWGLLLSLRDALGFFGDVLSYARLMALGLATAFLAMTINIIAELLIGIPYGLGYVCAILILVLGHSFNLAINCLGAFVHTLRLQYLEFFSKFFIGGGEPFKPYTEERRFTIVRAEVGHATQE
ncbi:MAG: V-type ATP synthase subunit I [Candidatus Abyssubacteria bacterium]